MTFTEQEVETIVLEVIRRLGVLSRERDRVAVFSGTPDNTVDAELTLKDKVITLRTLEGKLNGVSRVLITSRTIVTPAARDELKQRRIEVVHQPRQS